MMFKKSQLGWRLVRQCLASLQEQKKALIFPLIGRGFFFLLIIGVTVLAWAIRTGKIDYNQLSIQEIFWGYVIMLLVLWFGNFVSAFFNAAFTACLLQNEVNLEEGLRTAKRHLWTIFCWIVAHFTLGFAVMLFRKKFSESGRINQLLSGLSWGLATFLFTPLIINEPAGFQATLQRSSQLMRNYAGPTPVVNYRFTWLSWALRFLSIIPITVGYHLNHLVWIVLGTGITFILLLGVMVMFNVVFVVLQQALYEYIAHQKTIPHFRTEDLDMAIV